MPRERRYLLKLHGFFVLWVAVGCGTGCCGGCYRVAVRVAPRVAVRVAACRVATVLMTPGHGMTSGPLGIVTRFPLPSPNPYCVSCQPPTYPRFQHFFAHGLVLYLGRPVIPESPGAAGNYGVYFKQRRTCGSTLLFCGLGRLQAIFAQSRVLMALRVQFRAL